MNDYDNLPIVPNRFHVVKAREGLELVEIKPGVRRWKRVEPKQSDKDKPKTVDGAKSIPTKEVEKLKSAEDVVKGIELGATEQVSKIPVTNIDGAHYGVEMYGKKLVAIGTTATAALVQYALILSATAGAASAGDLQGTSTGYAKELGRDVEGAARSTATKVEADRSAKATGDKTKKSEDGTKRSKKKK